MTKWTHEEMREVYQRAERAEDALANLVETINETVGAEDTDPEAVKKAVGAFVGAIRTLRASPRKSIRDRGLSLPLPEDTQ